MLVVHGHGRGKRLGACLVVKLCASCVVSLQHVSMFDYARGARAWKRQAPWYVPCGEVVCVVCREFVACVHASLTFFAKNRSIYTLHICAPKGYRNCACTKTKCNTFIIKYRSTSVLIIHSGTLHSSLYIRFQTKLLYIYTHFWKRPEPPNHCCNNFRAFEKNQTP